MIISQPSRLLFKTIMLLAFIVLSSSSIANKKQTIQALYIPLADHYAALVAYERYRDEMVHADFQIKKMGNWDLLRAYFQSGEADMAFVMSPLAMDMYREKPNFRWIGLMHRDGNALAINELFNQQVKLAPSRAQRLPTAKIAEVLKRHVESTGRPIQIGVPHCRCSCHYPCPTQGSLVY